MKHLRPLAILFCSLLASCGWWSGSKTAAAENTAAAVVACAADAFLANPQITPEELATKCGPLAVADAAKILVAEKKLVGSHVGAPPCPSASASALVPVASASAAPKASK